MIPSFVDKEKIPHKPGIYMYKDERGKVLYVGKAIDLYHRVASYFNGRPDNVKTAVLVEKIRALETIVVESELEALILEANLIKKFLPLYNIRLTDDKDYLYIVVTKELFPKIITGRKKDLLSSSFAKIYFGPFPSSRTVKTTLKQLRRIFPWCQNPPKFESGIMNHESRRGRPCFYYHLGLCPGPCVGKISPEDYHKIIQRFIKFMEGKRDELLEELTKEMEQSSKEMRFEDAARVKKTIQGIQYLLQPNRVSNYLENPNFLEDQNRKGLDELQKALNLAEFPERIECYDISNFQGTDATGSMVVLTQGEIDKSQYRKFKIKISGKPNDYAMHQEMMGRRLKHKEWTYPQVFIIDGGRGQVRAASESIKGYVLSIKGKDKETAEKLKAIPVFGLAKREEWLYPPEGEVIKLPKRSLALRLVQKIRDESHRFAITYHRKLRKRSSGY
jgi:excinuclease ABC subunit C